jgi:hypothetical protein
MKHTTKINVLWLLYMDDLNLIGRADGDLQNQLQVARTFGDDIHMEFGLEFCKDYTKEMKNEFTHKIEYFISTEKIQALQHGKSFKNHGVEESSAIQ